MLGLVKDLVRQSKIIYYEEGRAFTPPEDRKIGEWDGNSAPLSPDQLDMPPRFFHAYSRRRPLTDRRTQPRRRSRLYASIAESGHCALEAFRRRVSRSRGRRTASAAVDAVPACLLARWYWRCAYDTRANRQQHHTALWAPYNPASQRSLAAPDSRPRYAEPKCYVCRARDVVRECWRHQYHHASKMERAVLNTLGKLSQWKHMLNPRSPFSSQPLKIVGQVPRNSMGLNLGGASAGTTLLSASVSSLNAGGGGKLAVPSLYVPHQRSPLRDLSIGQSEDDEEAVGSNGLGVPVIDAHGPTVEKEDEDEMDIRELIPDPPTTAATATGAVSAPVCVIVSSEPNSQLLIVFAYIGNPRCRDR